MRMAKGTLRSVRRSTFWSRKREGWLSVSSWFCSDIQRATVAENLHLKAWWRGTVVVTWLKKQFLKILITVISQGQPLMYGVCLVQGAEFETLSVRYVWHIEEHIYVSSITLALTSTFPNKNSSLLLSDSTKLPIKPPPFKVDLIPALWWNWREFGHVSRLCEQVRRVYKWEEMKRAGLTSKEW